MNSWKQPTPTNLVERFHGDKFKATIYMVLLNRATNSSGGAYVDGVFIPLKRGQCITGRFELAECFGLKRRNAQKVSRRLRSMEKVNKQVNIRKSRNCSIVTLLNYDEDVKLERSNEQSVNNHRTITEQSLNTNKSVKSVESDIRLNKNSTGTIRRKRKQSERKSVSYQKEWYDCCLKAYQSLKGIELKGAEFKPCQQALKTMFMSGRKPVEIIRCMEWFAQAKEDWTRQWTLGTVKKKLPEFLAGKLEKPIFIDD